MRLFLSGNEEVARQHLPVVQSKAEAFAALTEKRGLKQNAFYMNFDDTGARAVVSYCYGQLNVGISAPFKGGEEKPVEKKGRLYEWNFFAEIDRPCRGDAGAFFCKSTVFVSDFASGIYGIEVGSLLYDDASIPEIMQESTTFVIPYSFEGYTQFVDSGFFSYKLNRVSPGFVTETVPYYLRGYGLFFKYLTNWRYTPLFRFDDIYRLVPSLSSAFLPTGPIFLDAVGNMTVIDVGSETDFIADTTVTPELSTIEHPGDNLQNYVSSTQAYAGGWGGLWSGDAAPSEQMIGEVVTSFWGSTSPGALISEYDTYFPPHNTSHELLRVFSSEIDLYLKLYYRKKTGELGYQQFPLLTAHTVTASYGFPDFLYDGSHTYTTLGNESQFYNGTFWQPKSGDYALTHPGARSFIFGNCVIATSLAAPFAHNIFIKNVALDVYEPFSFTNLGAFNLANWADFEGGGDDPEDLVGSLESSRNGMCFIGRRYRNTINPITGTSSGFTHHIGFYEFYKDGLGGVTLLEQLIIGESLEMQNSGRSAFVWFSANYDIVIVKGSVDKDGIWIKTAGVYSKLVDGFEYTEPVYLSADGTLIALPDKIYVNGEVVAEPVECVGVYYTNDYFVDKVSESQFAIKRIDPENIAGTIIDATPDGLYNYYETTDDNSFALLSKTYWGEDPDMAADNALVVDFVDGPVKFEMSDTLLIRPLDPALKPMTPRYTSTGYAFPDWCRRFSPSVSGDIVYAKNGIRTLVAAHEDSFARRVDGLPEEERAVAFLWHPDIGVLRRLLNTTTVIPDAILHPVIKTNRTVEV